MKDEWFITDFEISIAENISCLVPASNGGDIIISAGECYPADGNGDINLKPGETGDILVYDGTTCNWNSIITSTADHVNEDKLQKALEEHKKELVDKIDAFLELRFSEYYERIKRLETLLLPEQVINKPKSTEKENSVVAYERAMKVVGK